jgi:hypothetical protein
MKAVLMSFPSHRCDEVAPSVGFERLVSMPGSGPNDAMGDVGGGAHGAVLPLSETPQFDHRNPAHCKLLLA